jgi:hypothetical protein
MWFYRIILQGIHIDPQNSCRWPLSKSANVDIAAENIAETYWQEIPLRRFASIPRTY